MAATLTAAERETLEAARFGLVRRGSGGDEQMRLGTWGACPLASSLLDRLLLTLEADRHDPGHDWLRPTPAGLNAIGVLTAEQIVMLPLGDRYDGMTVSHRSWTAEQSRLAETRAMMPGSDAFDADAFMAALGRPAQVLLTSDGGQYDRSAWCSCQDPDSTEWVRFERWSAAGREGHGFLHADSGCRRLLQAG